MRNSTEPIENARQPRGHRNPYHAALVELSKRREADPSAFLARVLETDAAMLGVARVSFWRFADGGRTIDCEDMWVAPARRHEPGPVLRATSYPRYFRALGESRAIAADDARVDPRTNEFAESYLAPNGITSMLDVPVWRGGRVVGILCHEHVGPPRRWTPEEQDFAAALADMIALGLESAERDRIAAALRDNEARLRLLTERMPGLLWTTDTRMHVTSAVGASLEPLGLRPQILERTSIAEWLDTTEPPHALELLHETALSGRRAEGVVHRLDRELEIVVEPFRDERGALLGVIGLAFDVTARSRADEERARLLVQERAARMDAELAHARAAFLADASRGLARTMDVDQCVETIAQRPVPFLADWALVFLGEGDAAPRIATALRGGVEADLAGAIAAYRPDLRAPDGVAQAIRTGRPVVHLDVTDSMLGADGAWPIVSTRDPEALAGLRRLALRSYVAVPLFVEGHPVAAIALGRGEGRPRFDQHDVALAEDYAQRASAALENAVLQRRLRDALRARDEFLSIAAHELYTPLTALHLSLEAVRRGADSGATDARKLEIATNQGKRLAKLIGELLDVSRIHAGALELSLERVDAVTLVRDAALQLEERAAAANTTIEVHADAPVWGRWDRSRMEQVLTNVLANAIKYGRGKPIDVTVTTADGEAVIAVRDQGIGIPRERIPLVFERFERAVSSRNYGGLGLGLYIVRQLVEAHRGRVAIESESGVGTTVTITLPRETSPARESDDARS